MKYLFSFSCLLAVALSQQWVVTIDDSVSGSSAIKSIAVDSAGDVYVTGTSERPLAVAVTARVSADGQIKWQRVFDPYTGFAQQGRAIAVDSSGCAYTAVASRDSTSAWCFATVKYLPDGSLAWHERYSDTSHYLDSPKDIALNPKGGCFVTGASGHNSWDYDYVTVSYDPFGTRRWVSTYDGPPHRLDEAYAVAGDYLGNCYVTGSSMDPERDAAVTIKYDSLGNPVWVNELAMPDADISGNDILVTPAGLVYVTGNSTPVYPALLTMKLDTGGDTLWKRTFLHGVGVRVKVDPAGNVYAVGTDDGPDIVVVKYNAAGVFIWSRTYDGPAHSEDWAYDMELGPDSSVYVCGTSRSRPYWNDFFVIKYGYRGDTLWEARLSGNSMYGNGARAMEVDKDGNVIVAGSLGDTVNGTDFVVAKFPPSGPGVAENSTPPVVHQQMLSVSPTIASRQCRFTVPASGRQSVLNIADIAGRTMRGIPVPPRRTGDRVSITWDTRDEHGLPVPNGVYFVALASGSTRSSCKFIVQR